MSVNINTQGNNSLDAFAYLGENTQNSTYPNRWLEERDVENLFAYKYGDYEMYQEDKCTNTIANDVVKNILEKTPLTDTFFSKRNLDHLQCLIIKMVYQRSNGQWNISRQSDNELLIVMRSIYLQYAQHLPFDLQGQVAELNKQVLLDVVPRVMSKIEQYLGYVRDQGSTIRPLPRGELATMAGTRTTKGFSSVFI